jgi:hypothetical protein
MDKDPIELPQLRLALLGFDETQQAHIRDALAENRKGLSWCLYDMAGADAWCINSARMSPGPGGTVAIAAATPDGATLIIDIDDPDRPLAFSLPVPVRGRAPCATFEADSAPSFHAMLDRLEGWLRPVAVQFWLGAYLSHERPDLVEHVYHLTHQGKLIAVVGRRHGVGVLPIADPMRLNEAVWGRRPEEAGQIPSHFVRCGLSEVLWIYAMRTSRDLLSGPSRTAPIYWCRSPQLSQRLFTDAHLLVARELAQGPATLAQLRGRLHVNESELTRAVAALRIVGAVSSDKRRAARRSQQHAADPSAPLSVPAGDSSIPSWNDKTAPAPLLARPA